MMSQKTVFGNSVGSEESVLCSELESFLDTDNLNTPGTNPIIGSESVRESIKHMLIGSPKAVTDTIAHLQVLGYASVGDWSPLLPAPNSGEVMSILVRNINVVY